VVQYASVHLLLSSQLLLKAKFFTSRLVGISGKGKRKHVPPHHGKTQICFGFELVAGAV